MVYPIWKNCEDPGSFLRTLVLRIVGGKEYACYKSKVQRG